MLKFIFLCLAFLPAAATKLTELLPERYPAIVVLHNRIVKYHKPNIATIYSVKVSDSTTVSELCGEVVFYKDSESWSCLNCLFNK